MDKSKLLYPGFSVVFIHTFTLDDERVFVLPESGEIIKPKLRDIENQIFILPQDNRPEEQRNVRPFDLKGFDFSMPIEPESGEGDTIELWGHCWVVAHLFFGHTLSVTYRFVFDDQACHTSATVGTDHIIALLSTFLSAEYWSMEQGESADKTIISLESAMAVSDFPLDENGAPLSKHADLSLRGDGRTFDVLAQRYKRYICTHCTDFDPDLSKKERRDYNNLTAGKAATVENDGHYAMVDIWESIEHSAPGEQNLFGTDRPDRLTEPEIVSHIRDEHMEELIGLMTLYPAEWPYRDVRAFDEVCGDNIAIDTDDLVLTGSSVCMVLGTYGRRGAETDGVDWAEHLQERSHYHVSWPEYLLILQMVLAKKHIIGQANLALIEATLNAKNRSSEELIGENAKLSLRLSRRVLQLDVVKYSKFPSHIVMFDRTTKRLGLDADLEKFNDMMTMVDSSLHNLADYKAMKSDFWLNMILAIISVASTFELFFQQDEMPFLTHFGIKSGSFSAVLLAVVAAITIFGLLIVFKNSIQSIWEKIKPRKS